MAAIAVLRFQGEPKRSKSMRDIHIAAEGPQV
jgi:hypothetical protein